MWSAAGLLISSPNLAPDPSGEAVIFNRLSGGDGDVFATIEAENTGVENRNLDLSGSDDTRSAIRSALRVGENADPVINIWSAIRQEHTDSGLIRPIDDAWDSLGISDNLNDTWRATVQDNGATYGVQFTYGYRSGVWYRPDTLSDAGIDAVPATIDEFVASFETLNAAGSTPLAVGAKHWVHGEVFETLLLRTAGIEVAAQLAAYEIPLTDPRIREVLMFVDAAHPKVADAFLSSETAANISNEGGLLSPVSAVNSDLYGSFSQISVDAFADTDIQFVLGDLLPGDLVDEYCVQLQRFLLAPSDTTIDEVLQAIEAKRHLLTDV